MLKFLWLDLFGICCISVASYGALGQWHALSISNNLYFGSLWNCTNSDSGYLSKHCDVQLLYSLVLATRERVNKFRIILVKQIVFI